MKSKYAEQKTIGVTRTIARTAASLTRTTTTTLPLPLHTLSANRIAEWEVRNDDVAIKQMSWTHIREQPYADDPRKVRLLEKQFVASVCLCISYVLVKTDQTVPVY